MHLRQGTDTAEDLLTLTESAFVIMREQPAAVLIWIMTEFVTTVPEAVLLQMDGDETTLIWTMMAFAIIMEQDENLALS